MTIRLLPKDIINKIAAGEVIERPSSVVKELMENSLDAGANMIEINIRDGGTSFLRIADNGKGMSRDELIMAVERHATSKLPDDDLVRINHFGFRGEALAAIGAVGRLIVTSKKSGHRSGLVDTGRRRHQRGSKTSRSHPRNHRRASRTFFRHARAFEISKVPQIRNPSHFRYCRTHGDGSPQSQFYLARRG